MLATWIRTADTPTVCKVLARACPRTGVLETGQGHLVRGGLGGGEKESFSSIDF